MADALAGVLILSPFCRNCIAECFVSFAVTKLTNVSGILDFQITIEKNENSKTDIKEDMITICNTVVNEHGKITVNDFHNFVEQITPDEEKVYENIKGFDPAEIRYVD